MIFKNTKKGMAFTDIIVWIVLGLVILGVLIAITPSKLKALQNDATDQTKNSCAVVVQGGKCAESCTGEFESSAAGTCKGGLFCCKPRETYAGAGSGAITTTSPATTTTPTGTTPTRDDGNPFDTRCASPNVCMQQCPSGTITYGCPAGKVCSYTHDPAYTCPLSGDKCCIQKQFDSFGQ